MNYQSGKTQTGKKSLKRCAVFKIDLNGRFVYVDAKTEKFFGLPAENLFGQSIERFVDEKSFEVILAILSNGAHYETFYESARLDFIDANGQKSSSNVVISLNFIAGNPANYQVVVTPDMEDRTAVESEPVRYPVVPDSEWNIGEILYYYTANLQTALDCNELLEIFLEYDKITQVGLYQIKDDRPVLECSRSQLAYTDKALDLSILGENCKKTAHKAIFHVSDGDGKYDGLIDACFPLIYRDTCWGVLRFIYNGDFETIQSRLEKAADFIGNALYSFFEK